MASRARGKPAPSGPGDAGAPVSGHGAGRRVLSGRYELADAIASGGMATIYLARQLGAAGFSRVVAVKRLHPHNASEPEFIAMFLDEARLAARVRHPHVVEMLDVVHDGPETFIVLEYVDGESLAGLLGLLRAGGDRMPLDVGVAIVSSACRGLHAAHQARGADGAALGIVHRDVSPQNILIGTDGVTRVTDFGVALANGRLSQTRAGQVKGKLSYMAPEQLLRDEVTLASDIYAAGVVLWEVCAGRRAYEVANEGALYARVVSGSMPRLADVAPWVPASVIQVVERALRREPSERFASAQEMADALEQALTPAPASRLGAFVELHARDVLRERRAIAAQLDPGATPSIMPPSTDASGAPAAAPSGAGLPGPRSVPPREDTQHRLTHTLTSPALGRRSGARALLFVGALLAAAGAGVGGAWFAMGRPGPGARSTSFAARTPSPGPEAFTFVSASAPASAAGGAPEPSARVADVGDASSSAAAMPDRMPGALPPRRPTATAATAAAASKPPCDPPYYIDAAGIRRVKRDCF